MPTTMTQQQYNLKNVRLTLNTGVVLDCLSISIARKLQLTERTPGASKRELSTINKEMRPDISIEGFNSINLSFSDIKPGSKVTAFSLIPTATGDNTSFLQSDFLTTWPVSEMYLGDTDTTLGESDNSKWKTALLCGISGSYLDTVTA